MGKWTSARHQIRRYRFPHFIGLSCCWKIFKIKFNSLGRFMATFDPLLCRIFLVSVLKRGCPGNMASSGKKREHDDPFSGVGTAGGSVKLWQPSLQIEQISYTCSVFHKKWYSKNSSHFLCCILQQVQDYVHILIISVLLR